MEEVQLNKLLNWKGSVYNSHKNCNNELARYADTDLNFGFDDIYHSLL